MRVFSLIWLGMALCAVLAVAPAPARADDGRAPSSTANTYALLIGSNPGGEGQADLHYAEDDAERFAAVLTQLGHFPSAHTRVLRAPDPAGVLDALDAVERQLAAHRARAEQAQFVFYYSGHARANALQLGKGELPLAALRDRILALPATLTLVVLDACQSGAFTHVKGAHASAAFSYNSVARLRTRGVAVMASSSESELSQESDALRGSYFTHHLTVALRGAGDNDHDGVVALDEAYRYAYEHTLSATARTAVGGQHVMLKTALTGQGAVPITYPAQADAQLELPTALAADVLVEHRETVVAELHKTRGSSLRLALPAGVYSVVVRSGSEIKECRLTLEHAQVTQLAADGCQRLSESEARVKGYLPGQPSAPAAKSEPGMLPGRGRPREVVSLELTGGYGGSRDDGYVRRLSDFGFHEPSSFFELDLPAPRIQAAFAYQLGEHLSAVLDMRQLDGRELEREVQVGTNTPSRTERFAWWTLSLHACMRAHIDAAGHALRFYAQIGVGPGLAMSKLGADRQLQFGPALLGAAGIAWMPWDLFGFLLQGSYCYAALLRNDLDETHDSGGLMVTLGLRLRFWSEP